MNEIIKASDINVVTGIETIDSFTLKNKLGISENTDHSKWVGRAITRARLVEGVDYITSTVGEQKVSVAQLGGASKTNDNTKVYHFTLDAVEMIGMLTDSDVGHTIRKEMQGYKKAYLMNVQHQLENQGNIIKTLSSTGSISSQAKNAGYRTALEIKDVLQLATGSSVIKRIAEYNMIPSIEVGKHTFYSVVHFIEAYRKFVLESELKTVQCKVTYQHVFTGLTFEHK